MVESVIDNELDNLPDSDICSSPPVERENLDFPLQQSTINAFPQSEIFNQPPQNTSRCMIPSEAVYKHMYWRSLYDAENFWRERALETLRWSHVFTQTVQGSFADGDVRWFLNGKLNVCDNCVDRWAEQYPHRTALIYVGDEPDDIHRVSYKELQDKVCRFANLLKAFGVHRGDTVTIYLPMIPEIAYAMLACARIGAIHSVVFAGFSAQSLGERIDDAKSRMVITASQSVRGGRVIPLKKTVDEALQLVNCVKHVIVFKKSEDTPFTPERDAWGDDLLPNMRPYAPLEVMDSEDVLFMLYTSGSTGKPKGVCHTTAGYLLHVALSHKFVFDFHPGDIFGCMADCGWITGHSYVVYGPLCNGGTTILFQSIPSYPNPGRYWEMVEKLKITQLYTAPTAIRALMRFGNDWPKKYNMESLRVLGTVGESINPEAWRWLYHVVGGGKCSIVDTYWQTETGGHIVTPYPGATQMKPGCAMTPFFGIELALLDPMTGVEKTENDAFGVLCIKRPWPGICRTVHRAHTRMINTYFKPYPGYYFTGDGAYRDKEGYYWITGRVDDTINVSGHRLSTAEIEHALVQHKSIAEAAVIGIPHDMKGSAICCFIIMKIGLDATNIEAEAKQQVRREIGPIATPDYIIVSPGLPKTQSGKIMRRLLRRLCASDFDGDLGDVSSLANPESVGLLRSLVIKALSKSDIGFDPNAMNRPQKTPREA